MSLIDALVCIANHNPRSGKCVLSFIPSQTIELCNFRLSIRHYESASASFVANRRSQVVLEISLSLFIQIALLTPDCTAIRGVTLLKTSNV
jgi:hypothetical protein